MVVVVVLLFISLTELEHQVKNSCTDRCPLSTKTVTWHTTDKIYDIKTLKTLKRTHHVQLHNMNTERSACLRVRLWAYYNCDPSTIRVRFEHDSATTRYEMRTIRARFEHDTASYEELCAFEQ